MYIYNKIDLSNQFIYYVYAYLREDNTPYYIGKGKNQRAYDKNHTINLPKDHSKIIFLETNLSEIGALALERRYIRWYGRKDNRTGILRNLTDGGEGSSGLIITEEHRNKISESNSQRKGRKLSKESKEKISLSLKGQNKSPKSNETKQKISDSKKSHPYVYSKELKQKMKKPKSKIECPHCHMIGGSNAMKRWHFDSCQTLLK